MPLLELRQVSKNFGAVRALAAVDLDLGHSEVIGVMGDNGAGKTTLVKLIAGNFRPDAGEIRLDGESVRFNNAAQARMAGIEAVYQDLALCNNLTAAANVFLGRELETWIGPVRILDHEAMLEQTAALLRELHSGARPGDQVGAMSGGERQAVAIARMRLGNARIVVMDEPTAAMGVRQIAEVLNLIRRFKTAGLAIIFVSHRVEDVFAVSDRIIVLDRGRKIIDRLAVETSEAEISAVIAGAVRAA